MNRIDNIFKQPEKKLSLYLTAGYPEFQSTIEIVTSMDKAGVSLVEIGIPFSDPLADGPVIQNSSSVAINNGMNIELLLNQIAEIRKQSEIPIVLMGYYNPILKYGDNKFFADAIHSGVDGFLIPDLPMDVYRNKYKNLIESKDGKMIFMITPQTSENRIREIDKLATGFIYIVSSFAVTGGLLAQSNAHLSFFEKVKNMKLRNPTMIGFGISNKETFDSCCAFANGAIIGSSFIKSIETSKQLKNDTEKFVRTILS